MPSAGLTGTPTEEPSPPPIFIDRNSGGRAFRAIIESSGIRVVLHDDIFTPKTEDPAWLAKVGESGWLIVTGDDATTRQPLFLFQLEASQAHVFVLLGLNGTSAEKKAACIVNAFPLMCRLAAEQPPPAVWRIGKDGKARAVDVTGTLIKMRKRRS